MNEAHRSTSPSSSLFIPAHDDHYHNEHATRRPRLSPSLTLNPIHPPHFPGDGLDFRRPAMTNHSAAPANPGAVVIDLTDNDDGPAPAAQSPPAQAAALTASSSRATRFPRFGRNIIDVDSDSDELDLEPEAQTQDATLPLPGMARANDTHSINLPWPIFDMDDVEIVSERSRPRPREDMPRATAPRSITPHPNGHIGTQAIDLTGEDDDIVHVDTRAREVNAERPQPPLHGTRPQADNYGAINLLGLTGRLVERFTNHLPARLGYRDGERPGSVGSRHPVLPQLGARQRLFGDPHPRYPALAHHDQAQLHERFRGHAAAHAHAIVGTLQIQPMMNYEAVAFDLGLPGGNRPASPKYSPPPDPGPGFTRNPGEDEIVVCPNCGDELAMGDTELKQEVWVIKQCGHAYCGECAHNRSKGNKASKKGKGKARESYTTAPFKTCVVDNCKGPAGHKSMVHVFLGS